MAKTIIVKVDPSCTHCKKKMCQVLCKYKDEWNIEKIEHDEKKGTVKLTGPFDVDELIKKLCCKAGKVIINITIPEEKPPPPVKLPPPPQEVNVKIDIKVPEAEPCKPCSPKKPKPCSPRKKPCSSELPNLYPFPYPYPFPAWYPSGCGEGPCRKDCTSCSCCCHMNHMPSGCGCGCGSSYGCRRDYGPPMCSRPTCTLLLEEDRPAACNIM